MVIFTSYLLGRAAVSLTEGERMLEEIDVVAFSAAFIETLMGAARDFTRQVRCAFGDVETMAQPQWCRAGRY